MPISKASRPGLLTVILALLLLSCLVAAIYPLPHVLMAVSHDDWDKLPLAKQVSEEAAMRAHLLQAVGGALLIVGSITAIRQLKVSQQQSEADRASKNVAAFTHSIELLAGPTSASRVAGVVALNALAASGGMDRVAAVDVLSSYVRDSRSLEDRQAANVAVRALCSLRQLGEKVDLTGSQLLQGATLSHLDLVRVKFNGCDLRGTDFSGSNLQSADLTHSDLSRAILNGADLSDAQMADARLNDVVTDSRTKLP